MNHVPVRSNALPALLLVVALLLGSLASPISTRWASAANPGGVLSISPIAAYNFVVDSNVESPSTYAPEAATIGARFCNNGTNDLTDVFAYVGDYNAAAPASSTPGAYPSVATSPSGQIGPFALTHEGGSAGLSDATRYVPRIPAGQCVTQYWLVSYPRLDSLGNTVTGGIKPDDDLVLSYDIWATANDSGSSLTADLTRTATMRNEISAAANKIWPNGDNKVPAEYKQAIAAVLGWDTFTPSGGTVAYPGQTVTTQGIWYDLGNVGAGFDNNGDGIPDYNAWVQPIGDPDGYDPGCFRLVRTYGIIIVKLVGGGEKLIPFVDNTYFQNIPANTGAVGLVYYQYAALDGACTARISPYQEVASGYDNEKFNGDYGYPLPLLETRTPSVSFTKGVDKTSISSAPTTLNYTLSFQNTAKEPTGFEVSVGDPDLGIPLVFSDVIPAGSDYVAGSATAVGTTVSPAGVKIASVRYSTDNGATWTTTEPAAASVTNLQWWVDRAVPQGDTVTVSFAALAPQAPPTVDSIAVIPNTAGVSFGDAPPFAEATATTMVSGPNSLSGNVFSDTGAGGNFANGTFDASESLIPNVTVSLYLDSDNDGEGDVLVGTTSPSYSGAYSFGNLPDGNYIVQLDAADADLPTGTTNTTPTERQVPLDPTSASATAVNQANINFGYAPALTIAKQLVGSSPIYEGDLVQYTIDVSNRLPGNGTAASAPCVYVIPATVVNQSGGVPPGGGPANAQWASTGNVTGLPDGQVATTDLSDNPDLVGLSGFNLGNQGGTITSVAVRVTVAERNEMRAADDLFVRVWNNSTNKQVGTDGASNTFDGGNAPFNTAAAGTFNTITMNVSGLRAWTWADFSGSAFGVQIEGNAGGGSPKGNLDLDAVAYVVTTDRTCGPTDDTTLNPVPLSDTYDPARLEFVSASPGVDSGSPGSLSWTNVGPLFPGQTKTINVTFRVLTPASQGQSTTNTASVSGAMYVNGRPAADTSSVAPATINYTGSIAGRVFRDANGSGWQGSTGYDPGDSGIPGASVQLYACVNSVSGALYTTASANSALNCAGQTNGTWQLVATQVTDNNGDYRFDGLRDGFYVAQMVAASLPSGVAQTAEASDTQAVDTGFSCPTCDDIWGSKTALLTTANFNPINTTNETINNVSFGYSVPASLYGTVWNDADGDGAKDAAESIIPGASVRLCSDVACATVLATTTTDANGLYRFTPAGGAGTYYIGVGNSVAPLGASWTNTADPGVGANDNLSDAITVAVGELSGSHDFGYRQGGALAIDGTLYYDWSGDAAQGSGEEGVKDVTVRLYRDTNGDGRIDSLSDPLVATQVTDASGYYAFAGLPGGKYIVVVDRADPDFPGGYRATEDPDQSGLCTLCDGRTTVTLSGSSDLGNDFGYQSLGTASIGDTVWYDRNADKIQSGVQERGLANISVSLQVDRNGDGTYATIKSASTDADGMYLFEGLPDGSYRVVANTADPQLPKDVFGNAYVPTTATRYDAVISGAQVTSLNGSACTGCDMDADFGFTSLGAIGDTIFWDANGNGQQDWNEAGVSGATVTLYSDVNGDGLYSAGVDTFVVTQITGADGTYLFTALPAGKYVVVATPPGGAALTADPNADGAVCTPALTVCDNQVGVNLTPGASFMGADFGYQPSGVIGDTIYSDLNSNGVQDAGEPGIAGVTVRLYDAGNALVSTQVSGPDGDYIFSNLPDGSYTVVVDTATLPAGYAQSGDPDVAGATCAGACDNRSAAVISAGGVDLAEDFGYRLSGSLSLSGSVCFDDPSNNGLCGGTAGETALAGQAVYLTTSAGVLVGIAITDASGAYSFSGLPAGNYRVAIGTSTSLFTGASTTTTATATQVTSLTATSASVMQNLSLSASRTGVDFAFKRTALYDFGDLPASYSTILGGAPDGARHLVAGSGGLYLGTLPDAELDGQPGALANGDGADEDGVSILTAWAEGAGGGAVDVSVVGSGYLAAWVDFNHNGSFADAGEMVISQAVSAGTATYSFSLPVGALSAPLNARFRLFDAAPGIPALAYAGAAGAGEVEDYTFFAQMQIDKDTSTPTVMPGGQVSYTIAVTNTGTLPLSGVTVSDSLPAGFTFASATIVETQAVRTAPSGPGAGDSSLSWGTWGIKAGGSVVITLIADVGGGVALGSYDNTASASSAQTGSIDDDGTAAQDSDTPLGADPETDEDVLVQTVITYTIGDTVWLDADNSATLDAGEQPLAGVKVNLYADTDGDGVPDSAVPLQTTNTSALGKYAFSGLSAGKYIVGIDAAQLAGGAGLAGYVSSSASPLSNTTAETLTDVNNHVDGDDNGVEKSGWGILSSSLTVGGLSVDQTVDFGLFREARLGNLIWLDSDKDGVKDAGEAGVAGVTITLYNSAGAVVATATSGSDGSFIFTHLIPGTYTLAFSNLPSGYTFTLQNQGSDAADSDVDPATGRIPSIAVAAGDQNLTLFAGLSPVSPTAITLTGLSVGSLNGLPVVRWSTGAELETAGFRVLRSTDGSLASAVRVSSLIPARGQGGMGASYSWTDDNAQPGERYWYWIEEVEIDGSRTPYGPVSQPGLDAATNRVFLPLVSR